MPKTYVATAVIIPPTSSESSGFLGLLSNLPLRGMGIGMDLTQQSYTFLAILNSSTLAEKVVRQYDLINLYQVEKLEQAQDVLRKNVQTEIRDDGMISISVSASTGFFAGEVEEDTTRRLAASMTNFFVKELDIMNINLQVSQARYNRIFIENRYNQNKLDLLEAEKKLKEFQEKYNAISLPDQLQMAIKTAAEIQAQIKASEVELGYLSSSLRPDNPEIQRVRTKITELKKVAESMQTGEDSTATSLTLFPAFSKAPDLGVQLIQLEREMETQNALYLFLTQQYEQAKIQEAKDTPTVQGLDRATVPEIRSKPKRALMVSLSGLASIFFSFLFIAMIEFISKTKSQKNDASEKFQYITMNLTSDIRKVRFWKRKQ